MCRIIVLNYVSINAKSAENAQVLGGKKQNPADPSKHTGRDICWVCNSKIRGRTALLGEIGGVYVHATAVVHGQENPHVKVKICLVFISFVHPCNYHL